MHIIFQIRPSPAPTHENGTLAQEFARLAGEVCGKDAAELAKRFSLQDDNAPFFCLDLSFCHTVLTQGFDMPDHESLTLVKKVKYGDLGPIDASWSLGAAIDELSTPAPARRQRRRLRRRGRRRM